jgi:hypothetical protein
MHENFRIKEGVGGLQVFMFVRFYVCTFLCLELVYCSYVKLIDPKFAGGYIDKTASYRASISVLKVNAS